MKQPARDQPAREQPVAQPPGNDNLAVKLLLLTVGGVAIAYYLSWWLEDDRLRSPLLLFVLVCALAYIVVQMVGSWVLNFAAAPPVPAPPPPDDLAVAVFVTAYHEPVALVSTALTAALAVRGRKTVWLLDDGDDPQLGELAQRLGCGYLTRSEHTNAKAGNVNAALPRTSGDVIAIFDVDHAPCPEFLEKSLGHFRDPKMGFVQVMLTFRNYAESWVARSAMESSLEFYNPTYLGADRLNAATLMGSNALIRRTALESIGGYQPGLAEDLATSLALHCEGWSSAYVAEPLAPGLSPASLHAWSVQQLKWARGVFEMLLTGLPKGLLWLTPGQWLSYGVRMTKYWIGPAVFFHLAATILVLFFADLETRWSLHTYLIHLAPLVLVDTFMRAYSLRLTRHPSLPRSSLLGAIVLVYASWPIYLLAWTFAVLRVPLKFRPTPKGDGERLDVMWLLPQAIALVLLVAGILYTTLILHHPLSIVLAFAAAQAFLQLLLLMRWVQADILGWDGVMRRVKNDYADSNS